MQPVAVLSAVFCILWSLLIFVLEAVEDHIELACSMTGLVIVLYVVTIVSFCFPQVVDVSAFSNFTVFVAFSFVLSIC